MVEPLYNLLKKREKIQMGTGTHKGNEEAKRDASGNTNIKESHLQRRDVHLCHGRYDPT